MPSEPRRRPPLELWGGVECTVNRVGDAYLDQLELSGHAARPDDLDRFAELGIRALRYPVLWERMAPNGPDHADWRWPDERLAQVRALGIRPIVGLVHHGSGPRHTSLVDPAFVDGLAAFARAVAERYPWVEDYTPVNEPLTTARFSGLYGHWYPHGRDELTCARALLTQCRAVVAAMRAIRTVNPAARLVQTEDLGKVFSTAALRYQADFENERRWLSLDLLCGRVDRDHWMWHHLRWLGIGEEELTPFQDHPCPPDVIGINHYVTSERFLDERLERYPPHTHGGNGRHAYADVEAVRVLADGPAGPETLLREVWERYRRPFAVTEVHLGCTREEQLRWFAEVWDAARRLRDEGADVRAVTAWSLLGAFDWDSLLTRPEGRYEPGVFDLRAPRPRPTALTRLLRDLAAGRDPDHPLLGTPGWWLRPGRLIYSSVPAAVAGTPPKRPRRPRRGGTPPVLIVAGPDGLGAAFARHCAARSIPHRLLGRDEVDLAAPDGHPAAIEAALATHRPWAIVDADAPARIARATVDGSDALAAGCARRELPLLTFSSDLVFDGTSTRPYVESDPVAPTGAVGQAAAEAESRMLATHGGTLVVRHGPCFGFGEGDAGSPVIAALRALAAGEAVTAAANADTLLSPTYVPDLIDAGLDLLIDGERGIWHLANAGAITWGQLLERVAGLVGLDPALVRSWSMSPPVPATLPPRHRALASGRGWILPPLEDALARYAREWETNPAELAGSRAAEVASLGAARRADEVAARRAS